MAGSAARVGCFAAALLAGPLLTAAHGQANQPVYPAYDGFLKNPDGSFTLAFAYFSHNANVVTIPPGPNNSFSPEPGDRQQPLTVIVVRWRWNLRPLPCTSWSVATALAPSWTA